MLFSILVFVLLKVQVSNLFDTVKGNESHVKDFQFEMFTLLSGNLKCYIVCDTIPTPHTHKKGYSYM